MKFTIERSKWLRGDRHKSCLLRKSDGKMCCLGFYALAAGLPSSEITNVGSPDFIRISENKLEKLLDWPTPTSSLNNDKCVRLMLANDSSNLLDHERESKLTDLFASIGDEVTFVD